MEVTMGFAQQKHHPDSAGLNPTAVHMHHVSQRPWGDVNT